MARVAHRLRKLSLAKVASRRHSFQFTQDDHDYHDYHDHISDDEDGGLDQS